MPKYPVFPHKTKIGKMPMEIDPPEDGLDIENRTLPLYLSESASFDLKVHGKFEPDFLTKLIPDFERDSPPVDINLTLESTTPIPGQKAFKMEKTETGYKGTIPLDKDTWQGTVKLRTVATRNTETDPTGTYASKIGALLASSETVLVYINQPESPPGTSLDMEWANFTEKFPDFKNEYSHVDILGATPKIWLNSSIPEFQTTLESQATTGKKKMIKDIIMGEIAVGHWVTLITLALMELKSTSIGDDPIPQIDSLDDSSWQRRVLDIWSMDLFPDASDTDEADQTMCNAVSNQDQLTTLIIKLEQVVGSRVKRISPNSYYRRLQKINEVLEQNNG